MRLARVFLSVLLTVAAGFTSSASATSACERALESLVIVTRIALEQHELDARDVEYMVARPDRIRNPFEYKDRTVENLTFQQKFALYIPQITRQALPDLHARLQELIHKTDHARKLVAEAKWKTRNILEHKQNVFPTLHDITVNVNTKVFWHKDKQGDLQFVTYDPHTLELKMFSLDPTRKPKSRTLKSTFSPAHIVGGIASFISLKDGNLVMAHVTEGKNLFVYDYNRDQAATLLLGQDTKQIHTAEGPQGQVYVIVQGLKSFSTYSVEGSKIVEVHHVSVSEIFHASHLMVSSAGRILIAYSDYTRMVNIVDPISKAVRQYQTKDAIQGIDGLFLPDGSYIYALATKSPRAAKYRAAFLDSNSNDVRYTDYWGHTNAGPLFRTSSGKVYLPVAVPFSEIQHQVVIYDAFQAAKPRTFLKIQLAGSQPIAPTIVLKNADGRYSYKVGPQLFEPRPGRLFLVNASENPALINIYEPSVQLSPIGIMHPGATFKTVFDYDDNLLAPISLATGSLYMVQFYSSETGNTEFFGGLGNFGRLAEVPMRPLLPPVTDKDGYTYLATRTRFHSFNPKFTTEMQVIQLTIGVPE